MRRELVSAPWTTSPLGNEPVTLADAKAYLRVDGSDEDDLITDLIKVARNWCEVFTARALVSQSWKIYLQEFPVSDANHNPDAAIYLPFGKCTEITSFTYVDADGVTQEMVGASPVEYQATLVSTSGAKLTPEYGGSWPSPKAMLDPIVITGTFGYGAESTDIPAQLLMAIKWMVADLFETRGDQDVKGPKAAVAEALARPFALERV